MSPLVPLALALMLPILAVAQPVVASPPGWVPHGADPATGARPANEIGTGLSLPTSDQAGDDAAIHDYLSNARNALAAGRTGEAQEALERAESRALSRSVPLFQTATPVRDRSVEQISKALHALGDGDRLEAMRLLEQALAERQHHVTQ